MALITDAATAWSSPITLTQDEVWQTRKGSVFLTTTSNPDARDGMLLREGYGLRLSAGRQVQYRKDGTDDAVIVREGV
ncbi:MAG: hypothetical protein AAGP08_00280 [Pseudomonadota bacterium]